jgi:excisionase family DNA binding protein
MNKAVWRPIDVAYCCSLRESTVLRLVAHGRIPYRKVGRSVLFLPDEIDAWLHALPGVGVDAAVETSHAYHEAIVVRRRRAAVALQATA